MRTASLEVRRIKGGLKNIVFSLFIFSVLIPLHLYADIQASVLLDPENPTPYSNVELRIVSYSIDVDTAMITWSSGDKVLLSGRGEKKLTVRTKGVGESSTLKVKAETEDGDSVEQEITVTPASVSVMCEAPESNVPLFYEGKSLPGPGATVRCVALPSIVELGAPVPAKNVAYSWYKNDIFIDEYSGSGDQFAYIPLSVLDESTDIKVIAKGPRGATAERTITVSTHEILPIMYTVDPILGSDYTAAVGKRFETTEDFTLHIVPFYLSNRGDFAQSTVFSWSLDGLPISSDDGTTISLHPKENSYGSRTLSVSMSNSRRITQESEISLDLVFDTRK